MKHTKHSTKEVNQLPWHRLWMHVLVASMALICLISLQSPIADTAAAATSRGRCVAYVSDQSSLKLSPEDANAMDQLNYSFALIENGVVTGEHWRSIEHVKAFLRAHPHITGVMAVGGWGADGFSQACASAEGRQQLAESILALMDEHGFTGVDIDWEYPGSSVAGIGSSEDDLENWYELLALLRKGLDERTAATGKHHILSVALGAGESQLNQIDGKRLNQYVDQAVVMAYDLCGFDRQTGHHAGLYPDDKRSPSAAHAVQTLIRSGLPARKMLLGIPAYGRMWRHVSGDGNGLHQRAGTSGNKWISAADVAELEMNGYTRYWDEKAKASWWYDGNNFVSAEDDSSLNYKSQWIIDQGMMGSALWSLNHDTHSNVLKTLHQGFQ